MLSFAIYNFPLRQLEELNQAFHSQKISPLQYQATLSKQLIVAGFDTEVAQYVLALDQQGKSITKTIPNHNEPIYLAFHAHWLQPLLQERVAFVEQHLLRDIRQVNKSALAKLTNTPQQELSVVLIEEK